MHTRGPLRKVERAIGGVEVVPFTISSGKHIRWNTHAHVIFDLPVEGLAPLKQAQRLWPQMTKTPHSFFGFEEIRSEPDVIGYVSKSRDVCPDSGILTPWELEQFMIGTKNRKFPITWGLARRGARKPEVVSIDELFDDDAPDGSVQAPGRTPAPATIIQGKRSSRRRQIRQPRERRWIIRIRRSKNSTLAPFIRRSRPKIDSAANLRGKKQKAIGEEEKTRSE